MSCITASKVEDYFKALHNDFDLSATYYLKDMDYHEFRNYMIPVRRLLKAKEMLK